MMMNIDNSTLTQTKMKKKTRTFICYDETRMYMSGNYQVL